MEDRGQCQEETGQIEMRRRRKEEELEVSQLCGADKSRREVMRRRRRRSARRLTAKNQTSRWRKKVVGECTF